MKKILYLLATTLTATSLQAADITSPFYIPQKGKILSTTAIQYEKDTLKNAFGKRANRQKEIAQEFSYGLSDKVALHLSGKNSWNRMKASSPDGYITKDSEPSNTRWSVGADYNLLQKDNLNGFLFLKYLQKETHHQKGAYKAFNADMRFGYEFKDILLPYIGGVAELPFAQSKYFDNDMKYGLYAGVYKNFCEKVSANVRLDFGYDKWHSTKEWSTRADISFYMTENTAIGLYGQQNISGKTSPKTDVYKRIYGLDVKVEF